MVLKHIPEFYSLSQTAECIFEIIIFEYDYIAICIKGKLPEMLLEQLNNTR